MDWRSSPTRSTAIWATTVRVAPIGSLDPDAPIITFSSLSKAYLAPGWRAGWMGIGRSPRLNDVVKAIGKLADGRLCSTLPMQYAITAALTGDRSHQVAFRAALKERAALTTERLNAIPGITSVAPTAAFYAMPRVALPPGANRRGLRARAAARDRRPVRLRVGLRHGARRTATCASCFSPRRTSFARSTT